jgi:transglutaminase-like putative cysteine protease
MIRKKHLTAGVKAADCLAAEVTKLILGRPKLHLLEPPHVGCYSRKWLFVVLALLSLFHFVAPSSLYAQFGIGLYKNGQLIDTFGPAATATNAAQKLLSAKIAGSAIPQSAVAPVISADTQARNQIFTDSALLGVQIRDALRQMQNPGLNANGVPAAPSSQALGNLLRQLIIKQDDVRAAFDGIRAHLVELKLPREILQRHAAAVATNEAAFAAFTSAVGDVVAGKPGALEAALKLLDQIKLRDEPDLTRRGPTHQAMTIISAPTLTDEQANPVLGNQSKAAAAPKGDGSAQPNFLTPPTTNDLVETPDVQLTSAIRAKAASLGNAPEAIYEFVRNNVKFQPYLGSRKGADFTLQQLAGNDTDQASLLIALLRAANIPCRYVRGTVELTPTQATSWLGVDDLSTAANVLATAGLNGSFYNGNVRCTHVWVEAYVPYSNYRGVPNDQTGLTWIPLDPAFKLNTITQGQDVLTAMGYNNDAFLANYVTTYHTNGPIQTLTTNIQLYLNANQPGTNVANIERTVATQPLSLGLLPASLPVNMITSGAPFSALDDTNRYKIRFNLYNGGTTFINFTTNLCQLAGHRVMIGYVGATTNDQAVINAHGGIYQTPPYLVNVKPVLELDGTPLATSASSIGMGYQHNFDIYFTQPAGDQNVQPVIYHYINAGNNEAVGLDTFMDVPNPFLAVANSSSLLDNLLNANALNYLSRVDRGEEEGDRLLRTVHTVDVSDAVLGSSVSVSYSFGGVPQTFAWTGMFVDAKRRIIGPFGANGDNSKVLPFMKLTGYDGSFMENQVFEFGYKQRAVSTIRILQWSHDQGIPTCYITNSISTSCPGFSHSSSTLSAVNTALASGHIVIIPQLDFTVGLWSGTGYIDLDPASGAAGYIISGGINGSATAAGGSTIGPWTTEIDCPLASCNIINPPNGAVFCADDTELILDSELTTQCDDGSSGVQEWAFDTGYTMKQLGEGVYTLTVSEGDASCSSTFTVFGSGEYSPATVSAVVSAPPELVDKIKNVINSIPGVNVNLKEVEAEFTAQSRDCCKDGQIVKGGERYKEGSLELSAALKGITLWGPPTIKIERDFGAITASIDIEVGVKLDSDFSVTGVVGYRESDCIPESCYYGAVKAGASISTKLTMQITGCVESVLTPKSCADIEFTPAQITVGVEGSVGYNSKEACNGWTGDVKLGSIEFSCDFNLLGIAGLKYTQEIYHGL